MTAPQDDYLWDPTTQPEPTTEHLERMLAPLSADALKLADRKLPLNAPSNAVRAPRNHPWPIAAAVAACFIVGLAVLFAYRLSWSVDAPWRVVLNVDGSQETRLLEVGSAIATGKHEQAVLSVARIGTVTLDEDSSATLVTTRGNKHRLELQRGRLHAKIWAPAGYFGVAYRSTLALDLGCEFDLETNGAGPERLTVQSGWVILGRAFGRGHSETLVPEGHSIVFDDQSVGIPLRIDASPELKALVSELDTRLSFGAIAGVDTLIERITTLTSDEDYLTLLILLSRHKQLTATAIHPRLEKVLGDPGNDDPINEWWQRVPKPPKQWWWHWRDAL